MDFGTLGGNWLRWQRCAAALLAMLSTGGALLALQRSRFEDPQEQTGWRNPAGGENDKTEWAFARLRYTRRSRIAWG